MLTLSLSLSISLSLYLSISTAKGGPNMLVFVHVDFEMDVTPQRRAQFCISHLGSWLRARRCSELTCRPSGATRHWKTLPFGSSASSFF